MRARGPERRTRAKYAENYLQARWRLGSSAPPLASLDCSLTVVCPSVDRLGLQNTQENISSLILVAACGTRNRFGSAVKALRAEPRADVTLTTGAACSLRYLI